jgi:hypothetical protein
MSGWGLSSSDGSLKYTVFDIKPPKECDKIQRNIICVSSDSQTTCIVWRVTRSKSARWGTKFFKGSPLLFFSNFSKIPKKHMNLLIEIKFA